MAFEEEAAAVLDDECVCNVKADVVTGGIVFRAYISQADQQVFHDRAKVTHPVFSGLLPGAFQRG
jgi:hypothetical protein